MIAIFLSLAGKFPSFFGNGWYSFMIIGAIDDGRYVSGNDFPENVTDNHILIMLVGTI
jgi:hypothetical protein